MFTFNQCVTNQVLFFYWQSFQVGMSKSTEKFETYILNWHNVILPILTELYKSVNLYIVESHFKKGNAGNL